MDVIKLVARVPIVYQKCMENFASHSVRRAAETVLVLLMELAEVVTEVSVGITVLRVVPIIAYTYHVINFLVFVMNVSLASQAYNAKGIVRLIVTKQAVASLHRFAMGARLVSLAQHVMKRVCVKMALLVAARVVTNALKVIPGQYATCLVAVVARVVSKIIR